MIMHLQSLVLFSSVKLEKKKKYINMASLVAGLMGDVNGVTSATVNDRHCPETRLPRQHIGDVAQGSHDWFGKLHQFCLLPL